MYSPLAPIVSQWLITIRLMYLILVAHLLTPPLNLKMPSFVARQQDPLALVIRNDYGLEMEKPKKNRFEKLAMAIAKAQDN